MFNKKYKLSGIKKAIKEVDEYIKAPQVIYFLLLYALSVCIYLYAMFAL